MTVTVTVFETWRPRPETLKILLPAREFVEKENPVTIRQTFYHLVTIGTIDNSQKDYKRLVKILTKARKAGIIPFGWIVDLTRSPLILPLYPDIKTFLKDKVRVYYRDTWLRQPFFMIIWLEKQALQEIVWQIANQYNVPLFVGRGYSSWDLIIKASELLRQHHENGKRLEILYLGDYDPSGEDMLRDLSERLGMLGIEAELYKIALTETQVREYNLPHQKIKSEDPRAKNFISDFAVELDALHPSVLRELIKKAIERFLDISAFYSDMELEKKEKGKLLEKVEEIVDEPEED